MLNCLAIYYNLLSMNYQKLINSNIKELRQKNNLTQEEFAEKVNLSIQGLSNIERNRYQPTAETIDRICKTFNILPAELLMMKENTHDDLISNIIVLLKQCSPKRLKKIYEIIRIMIKF